MENSEIRNFYDLTVWKKAHQLSLDVYRTTKSFPREEIFGITSQLRRASSSVTANIAEGFERFHFKDKMRFYYQARGSVAESVNFFMLAKDLDFISSEEYTTLINQTQEVHRLLNDLLRSLEIKIKK